MERGDAHDGQGSDCKWSTVRYIHKSEDVVTRHRLLKFAILKLSLFCNAVLQGRIINIRENM